MDNPETEDQLPEQSQEPDQTPACIECGKRPVLEGYPNALCGSCREKFLKFPVPKWVSGFGIAVLLLVAFGLVSFPAQISTGLHLKRAENAAKNKNFLTAKKELTKVLESSPNLTSAEVQLMIADFYNMDEYGFAVLAKKLSGQKIESSEDLSAANELAGEMQNYFPSDSLTQMKARFSDSVDIPRDSLRQYIVSHDSDPYALVSYLNLYYDKEDLRWSDSAIKKLLSDHPDYLPGILTAIYITRMEGKYDSALKYCDELLSFNHELSYAGAAKARVLMAEGKLEPGIAQAKTTLEADPDDGYANATLALGYHLNHQYPERDKIISVSAKDSIKAGYMEYVNNNLRRIP